MIYLDSSVLVELYLDQPRAGDARRLLTQSGPYVSSVLLAIEVPIVLRRALSPDSGQAVRLAAALANLDENLRVITLVDKMPEIARRIREDARFAQCRALDAIHAATALHVQEVGGFPVKVATFDARLASFVASLSIELA